MLSQTLISLSPMVFAVAVAAVIDARSRRIPNWLSFGLVLAGFVAAISGGAFVTLSGALAGFAVGFILTFVLFALGALGGGDVKLLAGVGAWIGAMGAFQVFIIAALVGMVIVIAQCAYHRRLGLLFRNSALVTMNLVHATDVGIEHTTKTGQACRSVDRPLPYAVPVLVAVLIVLARSV